MAHARTGDVHDLEPPRPMQVVLDALRTLEDGEHLVVRHRREPFPLYPMLAELGFVHRVRPGTATRFEIVIWRATEPDPTLGPPREDRP